MKDKIKKAVCLALVFITTFVLTVTAFAEFQVENENFIGRYECVGNNRIGYILANEGAETFDLHVYEDDNYHCFMSGSSDDGKISNSPYNHFYAYYKKVKRVQRDGSPAVGTQTVEDYEATGKVSVKLGLFKIIKKVTISSGESLLDYVLEN